MNSNYILITIDALRADHLNIYGYKKRVTSPAIDQFAKRCDIYLNAYACGVPTFLSFPSIFCSIYPSKVMHNMYLPKNIPTFVELLKNNGFQTAAFIDYNPFCSSLLGYNRGFDIVDDYFVESLRSKKRINPNFGTISKIIQSIAPSIPALFDPFFCFIKYLISIKLIQPKKNAEQMIQNAIKFMKSTEGNFFVWLHFMDVHWPLTPPNYSSFLMKYKICKLRSFSPISPGNLRLGEETVQLAEEMHDMSIRKLDARLKLLFNFLQQERILENTYVFITSDHGGEFLERGSLLDHQENVYNEIAHVPLIIKNPDSEELLKLETMVSLLDISTTILINEKIPVPREYEGVSIFQNKRDYCISETVVPSVTKLAKSWNTLYKVKFNDFIYSIRDERYTIVYDENNKYKFFNRKDDVLEKKKNEVLNDDLLNLLKSLKEHQAKKHIQSFGIEKEKVTERIRKLKTLGKM